MLKWLESRAGCKESLVEGAPGYSPKKSWDKSEKDKYHRFHLYVESKNKQKNKTNE